MRFWNLVFIAVVAYGLFVEGRKWKEKRTQSNIVAQSLATGGASLAATGIPSSCSGKKYCITVFIAPWCGVCQASEPTFQSVNRFIPAQRPDVGFGLVIGADSADKNAQKRQDLSPIISIVDDSGDIMRLRQIKAFPTWIAMDEHGKEIFRRAGGLEISSDDQVPQVLKMMLE